MSENKQTKVTDQTSKSATKGNTELEKAVNQLVKESKKNKRIKRS